MDIENVTLEDIKELNKVLQRVAESTEAKPIELIGAILRELRGSEQLSRAMAVTAAAIVMDQKSSRTEKLTEEEMRNYISSLVACRAFSEDWDLENVSKMVAAIMTTMEPSDIVTSGVIATALMQGKIDDDNAMKELSKTVLFDGNFGKALSLAVVMSGVQRKTGNSSAV